MTKNEKLRARNQAMEPKTENKITATKKVSYTENYLELKNHFTGDDIEDPSLESWEN